MDMGRFFGIIAIVVVIVISAVLVVQAARFIIGDNTSSSDESDGPVVTIDNYIAEKAVASYRLVGEVESQETHQEIEIIITPSKRELKIYTGYDGNVTFRKSFKNTTNAYDTFMRAIAYSGMLQTRDSAFESEIGVCPSGRQTILELDTNLEGEEDIDLRSWATSCGRSQGTFGGNRSAVESLFEDQIPEYRDLTRGVNL